ncbi:MAG: hypothetical protein GYA58_14170 [Anaerolineaceae bacterium]|nr:hypothetical protein [Anaerolineaceae bacterium]
MENGSDYSLMRKLLILVAIAVFALAFAAYGREKQAMAAEETAGQRQVEYTQLASAHQELQAQQASLQPTLDEMSQQLNQTRSTLADRQAQLDQLVAEKERYVAELNDANVLTSAQQSEIERLKGSLAVEQERAQTLEDEQQALQLYARNAEQWLAEARVTIADLNGQVAALESQKLVAAERPYQKAFRQAADTILGDLSSPVNWWVVLPITLLPVAAVGMGAKVQRKQIFTLRVSAQELEWIKQQRRQARQLAQRK